MTPTNPASQLQEQPIADILRILLLQFQNLFSEHGLETPNSDIPTLARVIADGQVATPQFDQMRAILKQLISASEKLLQEKWGWSFAESFTTPQIPHWETTAELVEFANEKNNAELRISAGSSLLVALGEKDSAIYLLTVIEHDGGVNDADAVIAKRVLQHISGIDTRTQAGIDQLKEWLQQD